MVVKRDGAALLALWAVSECVLRTVALKCGTGAKFIPIHCPSDNLMVMKITEANSNSWDEDQECVSFHGIRMVRVASQIC